MSIRFETIKDLDRENKAADFLCNMFGFNKKKLSENDIDFAIYDNERYKLIISFANISKKVN